MVDKKERKNEGQLPIPSATGMEGDRDQVVKDQEILVQRQPFGFGYEFLFRASHIVNNAPLVGRIVYEHLSDPPGARPSTVMEMRPDVTQRLIDELWRSGLRPSDEIGYPGELAATNRHLKDMRGYFEKLFNRMLNNDK